LKEKGQKNKDGRNEKVGKTRGKRKVEIVIKKNKKNAKVGDEKSVYLNMCNLI
jgi:hypothetical protein